MSNRVGDKTVGTVLINLIVLEAVKSLPTDHQLDAQALREHVSSLTSSTHSLTDMGLYIGLITANATLGKRVYDLNIAYPDLKKIYNMKDITNNENSDQIAALGAVKDYLDTTHSLVQDYNEKNESILKALSTVLKPVSDWIISGYLSDGIAQEKCPIVMKKDYDANVMVISKVVSKLDDELLHIKNLSGPLDDISNKNYIENDDDAVDSFVNIVSKISSHDESSISNKSS